MKRALLLVCTLGVLGACSVLEPRADDSRYFLLRSLARPAAGAALDDLVLGLGPVTVPEHLDQYEMVDLVGPYELRYTSGSRWVEPLGAQLARTLADNLHALLGPAAVVDHPWFETEGVDLQVEVDFAPIRLAGDGAWTGSARWVLRDAVTRVALERNEFVYELGRDSIPPDALAERMSQQLQRLSGEIAAGVRSSYNGN